MTMDQDRIEAIETKLAYLEGSVGDIDALVYEYGRRTERLEEVVRELARRLGELGDEKAGTPPASERPPHY